MGYMQHKALVVTASGYPEATKALEEVRAFIVTQHKLATYGKLLAAAPLPVTEILTAVNGYASFAVLPDGSKEGWADSEIADQVVEAAIQLIGTYAYEDGSSPLTWGYMQFYDEEDEHWLRTGDDKPPPNAD